MHHAVPPAMPTLVDDEGPREAPAGHPTGHPTGSLSWTVHPAAADPVRAVMLVAILAVASTLGFEYSGSAALGILAFVMLALSLRSWFLPRHYTIDASGAQESGPLCATRHLAWGDVRTVNRGRFGVYLSTLHSRSRFVRDRGIFLRTAGGRTRSDSADDGVRALDRNAVLRFAEGATAAP